MMRIVAAMSNESFVSHCDAQDSDVYLLDDVLAAVDAPVAAELWERAIAGPLLQNKTRLVVTHSRRFAAAADSLLRLERGRVAYLGPPHEDPYGLQLWTPGIQPDTEVGAPESVGFTLCPWHV